MGITEALRSWECQKIPSFNPQKAPTGWRLEYGLTVQARPTTTWEREGELHQEKGKVPDLFWIKAPLHPMKTLRPPKKSAQTHNFIHNFGGGQSWNSSVILETQPQAPLESTCHRWKASELKWTPNLCKFIIWFLADIQRIHLRERFYPSQDQPVTWTPASDQACLPFQSKLPSHLTVLPSNAVMGKLQFQHLRV